MKKNPKVTIIVPAYNEEKNIKNLVNDLLNLDYDNYKIIIVVDKNTTDNTYNVVKEISKKNKKIKVIKGNKEGSAANRNLGYEISDKDTKYYAFTDSDCRIEKNWLKILINTLERVPKFIAGVGGINPAPKNDSKKSRLFSKIEETFIGAGGTAQTRIPKKIRIVDSIPNCNALYRKEVWENNKQDESLIKGQDGEFNTRIRNSGGKFLVNPKAIVWHKRPNTLKKHLKRFYWYGEASSKVLKKQKNKFSFILDRWYGFLPPLYFSGMVILAILSLVNPVFFGIFLVGLLAYLLSIILTTLQVIFSYKKLESITALWIIPLQHFAYSLGIIKEFV